MWSGFKGASSLVPSAGREFGRHVWGPKRGNELRPSHEDEEQDRIHEAEASAEDATHRPANRAGRFGALFAGSFFEQRSEQKEEIHHHPQNTVDNGVDRVSSRKLARPRLQA